jgi:hypothetical protein
MAALRIAVGSDRQFDWVEFAITGVYGAALGILADVLYRTRHDLSARLQSSKSIAGLVLKLALQEANLGVFERMLVEREAARGIRFDELSGMAPQT